MALYIADLTSPTIHSNWPLQEVEMYTLSLGIACTPTVFSHALGKSSQSRYPCSSCLVRGPARSMLLPHAHGAFENEILLPSSRRRGDCRGNRLDRHLEFFLLHSRIPSWFSCRLSSKHSSWNFGWFLA